MKVSVGLTWMGECWPRRLWGWVTSGWPWNMIAANTWRSVGNVKSTPTSNIYFLQHYIPSPPLGHSQLGASTLSGRCLPKQTRGHEFILVAIHYFTKWVEAASYATITSKHVAKFIKNNIICHYGVLHELISDNGSRFRKEITSLLEEFKIKYHRSSSYRPQTNGVVEAADKNLITIIEKMAENYKDWPKNLPSTLWGYRTSIRSTTGKPPIPWSMAWRQSSR